MKAMLIISEPCWPLLPRTQPQLQKHQPGKAGSPRAQVRVGKQTEPRKITQAVLSTGWRGVGDGRDNYNPGEGVRV